MTSNSDTPAGSTQVRSAPLAVSSPPLAEPSAWHEVSLRVNDQPVTGQVESRLLLTDFLRHRLGLTGTHVGCEQGSCGACTVLIDGTAARACLTLAVQADGAEISTVEGLAGADGELHPIQEAFHDEHGMQCGFCTPGFLMSLRGLAEENDSPDEDTLEDHLGGNLCRCTGYVNIRKAARRAMNVGGCHTNGDINGDINGDTGSEDERHG